MNPDSSKSLASKLFTARHIFFKSPGLFQRLRLYREFRRFAAEWDATEDFALKIRDVRAAPDNKNIPRVPNAGKIENGFLIMHNGIRVVPDSYTGSGMTDLMRENHGVHEPQEELAFAQVLAWLEERQAAESTMIELGSYWAFYSLWFCAELAGPRCFCVEPETENLDFGKRNFTANGRTADFTQAFVGGAFSPAQQGGIPTVSVDSLIRDKGILHVDILHADIQGYELQMLEGARESFAAKIVDYVFVSSHSNFLHYRCIETLERSGFVILAEADLLETYSTDGVIVAGRRGLPRLEAIPITPRRIA